MRKIWVPLFVNSAKCNKFNMHISYLKMHIWILIFSFMNRANSFQEPINKKEINMYTEIGKIDFEETIDNIFERRKFLRNTMLQTKRRLKDKIRMDMYLERRFSASGRDNPTWYRDPSSKALSTLDFFQGYVIYAAKSRQSFYIFRIVSIYYKVHIDFKHSPRVLFQLADAFAILYQLQRSPALFNNAAATLYSIIMEPNVTDYHLKYAGRKATYLYVDSSNLRKAYQIQEQLLEKFPNDLEILTTIAGLYMKAGKISEAMSLYERSLAQNPYDSYTATVLGAIFYEIAQRRLVNSSLSTLYLEKSIDFFNRGVDPRKRETMTPYFLYCFIGGLRRLKRYEEAKSIVHLGVEHSTFHNFWQRSSHYLKGLSTKPVWTVQETGLTSVLQNIRKHWKMIRQEALIMYKQKLFLPTIEQIKDRGTWDSLDLFSKGTPVVNQRSGKKNCFHAPKTCELLQGIPLLADNCVGASSFSVMQAGTHVEPHSGPSNTRLRVHLGLDIPESTNTPNSKIVDQGPESMTRLRVGNEFLSWKNGEMIVFDDSYDHEVWHFHPSNRSRMVLIVDLWHPELTIQQIAEIILTHDYDELFIKRYIG